MDSKIYKHPPYKGGHLGINVNRVLKVVSLVPAMSYYFEDPVDINTDFINPDSFFHQHSTPLQRGVPRVRAEAEICLRDANSIRYRND